MSPTRLGNWMDTKLVNDAHGNSVNVNNGGFSDVLAEVKAITGKKAKA